jgi:hypothetical protein
MICKSIVHLWPACSVALSFSERGNSKKAALTLLHRHAPSQNAEVKEISQWMAHLSARLQIIHATTQEALHELKTLYFEYRNLKARRQAIEEAEAEAEVDAGTG